MGKMRNPPREIDALMIKTLMGSPRLNSTSCHPDSIIFKFDTMFPDKIACTYHFYFNSIIFFICTKGIPPSTDGTASILQ